MSGSPSRLARRGFTLVEVLAAFVIALLMLAPITSIISGVTGSLRGVDRSTERRIEYRQAIDAAMAVTPLRSGGTRIGNFSIDVSPFGFERSNDLRASGWELYRVVVSSGSGPILETIRIARR